MFICEGNEVTVPSHLPTVTTRLVAVVVGEVIVGVSIAAGEVNVTPTIQVPSL